MTGPREMRVPILVRLAGRPTDELLAELEESVARSVTARLLARHPIAEPRPQGPPGRPLEGEDRARVERTIRRGIGKAIARRRTATGEPMAGADRVDRIGPYRVPVVARTGNRFAYAAGPPSVRSASLARAVGWGNLLFATPGFAVLEIKADGSFLVLGLADELPPGRLAEGRLVRPADAAFPHGLRAVEAGVMPLRDYRVVLVRLTRSTDMIFDLPGGAWSPDRAAAEFGRTPQAQLISPDMAHAVGRRLLEGDGDGGPADTERFLLSMDRTMFACIPWEERAGYIRLLADRFWPTPAVRRTLVELIAAARGDSELDALFSLLRAHGLYETLFGHLDATVVDLLIVLGERRGPVRVSGRYLLEILAGAGITPGVLAEGGFDGAVFWARATFEGIAELFEHEAGELFRALGRMLDLLGLLDRASRGDPEAVAAVRDLLARAGGKIRTAIAGLEYAERLGLSRGQSPDHELTAALLTRLRMAFVLEVLSWFVGVGEIKAAVAAVRLSAFGAELAKVLVWIRRASTAAGAAGAAGEAGKVERVVRALARSARIRDEARLLRVVELLPERHLEELARLAEALELPADATMPVLLAAARKRGLHGTARELAKALTVAGRLEAKAGASTAGLTAALTRLMETGWSRKELLALVDGLPSGGTAEWALLVGRLGPHHLAALGPESLRTLAYLPRTMEFAGDAGGDALLTLIRRAGAEAFDAEALAQGLALRRAELGDPAEYQRLLDRMAAGDQRVLGEAEAATTRFAAATRARLKPGTHDHLLATLAEGDEQIAKAASPARAAAYTRQRDRFAAAIGELDDAELVTLNRLADDDAYGGVDWSNVLDLPAGPRSELLGLVGELTDALPGGLHNLEEVLAGILNPHGVRAGATDRAIQGSWGQLYAARTLLRRHGATSLSFEVVRGDRVVDIVTDGPNGLVSVEVKTYLESIRWLKDEQLLKDLIHHAPTGYDDLLYLFHPNVAGELPQVGARMLELFDTNRARLVAAGVAPDTAAAAFRRWLAAGNPRTYEIPE
ncbi:hypothetical protein HII36_08800 [Nonomuraea sp. NN258]|uniref:hypothetical protein n=1 Tax=Nonomuraea antri TaxID=2730852 RepID=UPI00156883AB|nr:hypothetical protein [Nonomuraea antri]NRQ31937.1 hypothetical protein [Nonomuraea antri]